MKNNSLLFAIGQFSLFFGILGFLINYFILSHNPIVAFITGVLLGLSLVLNLAFLIRIKKNDGKGH